MATGNIGLSYGYQSNPTGGSAGTITEAFSDTFDSPWTGTLPGTGAAQFDVPYSDAGTLTATSKTYTLSALTGAGLGTAKVIVKLKEAVIRNLAAVGSGFNLILTPGGTNPCNLLTGASGSVSIPPGGIFALVGPDATGLGTVVAATSDKIKIDAGANTVQFKVQFKGTSV